MKIQLIIFYAKIVDFVFFVLLKNNNQQATAFPPISPLLTHVSPTQVCVYQLPPVKGVLQLKIESLSMQVTMSLQDCLVKGLHFILIMKVSVVMLFYTSGKITKTKINA